VAPAELVDVVRDLAQELVVPRQALEVVAGLLEIVELVGDPDAAVLAVLPEQEILELHAHLELVAGGSRPLELVAKDRPRVVWPLLALDRDVTRESRERRLPRNRREAAQ